MPEAPSPRNRVQRAPRPTAAERLERILYVLPAACREGGAGIEELAAHLDVTPKDLLSDIHEVTLRSFYLPAGPADHIQIEQSPERVSVWTAGEFRRPVKLSAAETVCVGLALRGEMGSEAPELLDRLESRMAVADPKELLDRLEASDLRHGETGIRQCLGRALQEKVSARIRYLKPGDDEPQDRTVRPYALVHGEGWWYLLAFCEASAEVRIFRMDRILAASPTGAPFQLPEDFDAGAFVQGGRVYRGGEETAVRVRYAPKVARWIAERESGEWDPDGGFSVTHRVVDPHWIVRHVLRYGPDAEVLEPEEARGWVRGVVGGLYPPTADDSGSG